MIDLPTSPAPSGATPALVDFGGLLEPMLGGAVQRVNRLGNRFRISVSMPPMPNKDTGRVWVSRLIRGNTEGARMPFPLLGFDPGTPGTPLVNGAAQTGRTLNADGFAASYAAKEGQPFSLVHDGRHYLHFLDSDATASSGGVLALPISPMLRVSPSDNDVLHFAEPMIEGFIRGEEWEWEMQLDHNLGLSFVIEEAA